MKQAALPSFQEYARQVVNNSRALGRALTGYGYKLATDGTDNHLILWDLRPIGLTGSKVERICDELQYTSTNHRCVYCFDIWNLLMCVISITINKNAVHGDVSALNPG